MAILEVTLQSDLFGQECINRWTYNASGTPASVSRSFALAFAFGAIYDTVAVPPGYPPDTILDHIANNVSNEVTFQQLTVVNVYDPTDFYQVPFVQPYTGGASGECSAPFVSFGFRTTQVRRDIARATKRFPGVPESAVGSGGDVVGAWVTSLNLLAEAMTDVLEYNDEGNTLLFAPCVVGKQEYDPNPTVPDANHRAYRYYPTLTEQEEHLAQGIIWQLYPQVRSQVSRQYGKGR